MRKDYARDPWRIRYSLRMPSTPQKAGPGWSVQLPGPNGVISYVICNTREIIGGGRRPADSITLSVSLDLTEGAVFDHYTMSNNTGTAPSAVRVMLLDKMSGNYNRWFSTAGIVLGPGVHTLTIPLEPAYWQSVNGKIGSATRSYSNAFRDIIREPVNPSIVFGGGLFYGHGTRLSTGHGTFRCLKLAA